jgi:hypothetical protein
MDAHGTTGEIANQPHAPIVPTPMHATAGAADRFFERRTRVTMRTFGSPNTPRTVARGRNPGKAYASDSRRCSFDELAIDERCQIPTASDTQESSYPQGFLL